MKKWFCDDGEGNLQYFETEKEALDSAASDIAGWMDDRWSEQVQDVKVGVITHMAAQINREDRPDDLDDEGYDEDGEHWESDLEYQCNYVMLPIKDD